MTDDNPAKDVKIMRLCPRPDGTRYEPPEWADICMNNIEPDIIYMEETDLDAIKVCGAFPITPLTRVPMFLPLGKTLERTPTIPLPCTIIYDPPNMAETTPSPFPLTLKAPKAKV